MDIIAKKNFIIRFVYTLLIVGIGLFIVKYALPLLSPFVIGLLIAAIIRPIGKRLEPIFSIKRSWLYGMLLLLFYVLAGGLLYLLGASVASWAGEFARSMPRMYTTTIEPALNVMINRISHLAPAFQEALPSAAQLSDSIGTFIRSASSSLVNGISGGARLVSGSFINGIVIVLSSVFLTLDFERIEQFISSQFSKRANHVYYHIKINVARTIANLVKAYAILMSLTFLELSIGFSLLRLPNPLILAMVISVVDILPILGTGTVLVPWGILSLLSGRVGLGAGLLFLYLIITVIRQALEPRIVGSQTGLHPLLVLVCIYAGGRLFGIWGIFGLPVTMAIAKKLNDDGVIRIFRDAPPCA